MSYRRQPWGINRIYCLDAAGKIHFAQFIDAASDDEVVAKAKRMKPDAVKCELWQHGRLVVTLQ